MIAPDRDQLIAALKNTKLEEITNELILRIDKKYANPRHGNVKEWQELLESLPDITPSIIDLDNEILSIGDVKDCTQEVRRSLEGILKKLSPWRKGPFNIFGINIDSEWRSNLKWSRIAPHVRLKQKLVLDIGSSNGYYALRMQAMGAKLILGIDPTWKYVFQYLALRKYLAAVQKAFVLPFALEDLPDWVTGYDMVFSMGVLYHRQEPQTHLKQVHKMLSEEGQLILETLIIEDQKTDILIPVERYANMRNVWMLPSITLLETWLRESGFVNITLIDKTKTTNEEQRKTEWSTGYSLANALDPNNENLTIEGYPAPIRAIFTAKK